MAQISLFKDLPHSELQHLAAEMRVVELAPETILFREGDPGDRIYIVLEGQIEVFQAMGEKEERIIAVRGGGDFIGEMGLLNPDGLRTASVRSKGRVKLWEMTRADFDGLIQRQPGLAYELARVLSVRMTAAQARVIQDLMEKNLELTRAYEELKAAQAQIVEKERLERELEVARDIQMSILPRQLPELPGFDFGARMVPARAVGGDFYDLIQLTDDEVAIVVGDVTGKGVPAAIFMAQIHALLHAGAGLFSEPHEVLRWVNRQLLVSGRLTLLATVLYGILDCRTGEFSFARAGHEPLVVGVSGGDVHLIPWDVGQLLGLLDDPILDEGTVTIPSGGTLLLYSDGITDGRSPEGEDFGRDKLMERFGTLTGRPAQDVCDGLWRMLVAFQGDAPQFDDVTLLAVHSTAQGQTP